MITTELIKSTCVTHIAPGVLPLQSVMEVANFCAVMDTLVEQDALGVEILELHYITFLQQVENSNLIHVPLLSWNKHHNSCSMS